MFNTTIHKHESKVVAVTKEIEKTITPDKVTEMYDKVKDEVENNFVRTFCIKDDIVNGIVVEFVNDHFSMQRKTITRIVINGKEFIFKDLYQTYEALSDAEMFDCFSNHYKNVISNEILKDIGSKLLTKNRIT